MTPRRADLTLLLATAMWGTSFVAVKTGLAYATPLAFLAVRFGIAALLLAPARVAAGRQHGPRLGGRSRAVRAAADRLDAGLRRGARLDGCLRQHAVLRAAGSGAASHVGGAGGADLLLRAAVCGRGLVARRGGAALAHPVGGRGVDRGRYGARGGAVEPSAVGYQPSACKRERTRLMWTARDVIFGGLG